MQDFMKLYSGTVERCFLACAQDFTSKALTSNEVSIERGGTPSSFCCCSITTVFLPLSVVCSATFPAGRPFRSAVQRIPMIRSAHDSGVVPAARLSLSS